MLKKMIIFILLASSSVFGSQEKTITFTPSELATQNQKSIISSEETEKQFTSPDFHHTFFKMLSLLGAIIVLFAITLWSFKKLTKSRINALNDRNSIKVLEKRILSPKSILYLVEYDGKKALVSESHLDMKIKFLDR